MDGECEYCGLITPPDKVGHACMNPPPPEPVTKLPPWEETWTADPPDSAGGCVLRSSLDGGYMHEPIGEIDGDARAKLAVQAPTMAQLLLEIHKDWASDGPEVAAIETVLRAAGVLP